MTRTNRLLTPFSLLRLLTLAAWACVAGGILYAQDSGFQNALNVATEQARRTAAAHSDPFGIPRLTGPDGRWITAPVAEWTSGFFPGTLWYLYEHTLDSSLKSAAIRWTKAVEGHKLNSGTHDVGFLVHCSFGNGYRITGAPEYREVLLQAARTLATRFNPRVGCIKSWDWSPQWSFPVIIDNMMNLELLMWASKNGGGDSLAVIATRHALTTMQNHFRPDGSTYHVVNYDPVSGAVLGKQTHQGAADSSVWARGQAWGIYGFTVMYRETRDPRFLTAARRAADYFLAHLPADAVPYWDFDAPGIPDEPRDASAAAITASALLELSSLVTGTDETRYYHGKAIEILRSLCSPAYLGDPASTHAILRHAVGNKPANKEVDVSLVYGDYYLVEALLRATVRPIRFTVSNPLGESLDAATVEIALSQVQPLRAPRITVREYDRPLISQLVDTDGSGEADLLIFRSAFAPHETKTFTVRDGDAPSAAAMTDARFVLPRHDLAWENDRIAFRMYGSVLAGDVNNGIDVWCKRVRYPIVGKWYEGSAKAGKDTYHEDRGEGADFFSVGRSLGAGSCGLLAGDSLLQPGLFTGHRVLATGPIRALFELRYDSAMAFGRSYQVIKRISLDAGNSLNRIEVVYTGLPATDPLILAAGIVRRPQVTASADPGSQWIALWGPTNADPVNGSLGTGIVFPRGGVVRETDRHLMFTAPSRAGQPFVYYAGAAWTRAGDVLTGQAWESLLGSAVRRLGSPLVITREHR
jgi:hypothetical protein